MATKLRIVRSGILGFTYTSPNEIKFKDRKPEDGQLIAARRRLYKTYQLSVYRASDDRVLAVNKDRTVRRVGPTSVDFTGWLDNWKNYEQDLEEHRKTKERGEQEPNETDATKEKGLASRNG